MKDEKLIEGVDFFRTEHTEPEKIHDAEYLKAEQQRLERFNSADAGNPQGDNIGQLAQPFGAVEAKVKPDEKRMLLEMFASMHGLVLMPDATRVLKERHGLVAGDVAFAVETGLVETVRHHGCDFVVAQSLEKFVRPPHHRDDFHSADIPSSLDARDYFTEIEKRRFIENERLRKTESARRQAVVAALNTLMQKHGVDKMYLLNALKH